MSLDPQNHESADSFTAQSLDPVPWGVSVPGDLCHQAVSPGTSRRLPAGTGPDGNQQQTGPPLMASHPTEEPAEAPFT